MPTIKSSNHGLNVSFFGISPHQNSRKKFHDDCGCLKESELLNIQITGVVK